MVNLQYRILNWIRRFVSLAVWHTLAHTTASTYTYIPDNGGHALFACGSNQLSKHWHCQFRRFSFQLCHGIRKQTRTYGNGITAYICNNEPSEKCVLWAWRMSRHKVTHAPWHNHIENVTYNILWIQIHRLLLRCKGGEWERGGLVGFIYFWNNLYSLLKPVEPFSSCSFIKWILSWHNPGAQ